MTDAWEEREAANWTTRKPRKVRTPKPPRIPGPREEAIQISVANHLAMFARPGVFAFHVPNEGKRSVVAGAKLKAAGMSVGIPDWGLLYEGRNYWLELKRAKKDGGRLRPEQHESHERMRAAGAVVEVAYGLDEALRIIARWGLFTDHYTAQIAAQGG